MRKKLAALLCAALCFATFAPAKSDTSNVAHPNENPPSTTANSGVRFQRLTFGSALRDFLSLSLIQQGVYANQTISPGSGMFVTLGPTAATSQGSLYQLQQDSPGAVPSDFTPNIPADTTLIGMLASLSSGQLAALGPITAPPSGESVYYLVEEQINPAVYSNPQSMRFLNPESGQPYSQTYNTQLQDQIVPQLKSGTPASSNPQVPAVDAGYTPIGAILVPSGVSQITSGMITQNNPCGPGSTANCAPFPGFATLGNVVALSAVPSPTPQTGYDALTGQRAGSQFIATATTGTPPFVVNSTTQVANLNAANAGLAGNITGIAALVNGGTGTATPSGVIAGGSGNWTCSGAFPAQTCDLAAILNALTSVTTSSLNATTATLGTAGVTNSTFTNAPVLSSLLNQQCLATNSGGTIVTCTLPTVPTFNGTSPITVATPPGSVTIACSPCIPNNAANTYTTAAGNQILPPAATATVSNNYGSVGGWCTQSSLWISSAPSTYSWCMLSDLLGNRNITYNNSNILVVQPSASPTALPSAGGVLANAASFNSVTDQGLTSGHCVQASTNGLLTTVSGACGTTSGTLTGITAGSGITVTGGAPSPTVAFSPCPPNVFTQGTTGSGTYTTPTCNSNLPLYIRAEFCGGGGGGGGSGTSGGNGTAGTGTTFNGLTTSGSNGGAGSTASAGGTNAAITTLPSFGTPIPGAIIQTGANLSIGANGGTGSGTRGANGGASTWGSAGNGNLTGIGGAGGTCAGGAAGYTGTGAGSGAGGNGAWVFTEEIYTPTSSYSYTIGTGGGGGTAGTNGFAGGSGGNGYLIIVAYWQ